MGKHRDRTVDKNRSKTLPSSPSHSFSSSSSSSDFEFTIAISPRKSSAALCPADELFYKGQLLPLHLSPRISMVRTLLLSSNSSSSSTTTTARDSSSSTDSSASTSSFASDLALLAAGIDASCHSSGPSSAADDESPSADVLTKKLLTSNTKSPKSASNKYFSLSRFSNVFKKDPKSAAPPVRDPDRSGSTPVRKTSSSAKEVIRKYLKKVKPLYEKLSQRQQQQQQSTTSTTTTTTTSFCSKLSSTPLIVDQEIMEPNCGNNLTHSFSGNLGCPRRTRTSCAASCPSSMRSSPTHSGVLSRAGFNGRGAATTSYNYSDSSTMEELQSAIQSAIAHCKNSMVQSNKAGISNEI